MKTLKWLLAGLILGVIAVAFRDLERGEWLSPSGSRDPFATDEEPVLGYDGMDQETLLDWLDASDLDDDTVDRVIRYEESNLRREPVLDALRERSG